MQSRPGCLHSAGGEGNEILIGLSSFHFCCHVRDLDSPDDQIYSCYSGSHLHNIWCCSGPDARPSSETRHVLKLTCRIFLHYYYYLLFLKKIHMCLNLFKETNGSTNLCRILGSCLRTTPADTLQTHRLIFHLTAIAWPILDLIGV